MDHLGSVEIWCPRCECQGRGERQVGESFKVICGSGWGLGSPWMVRRFLKHVGTAGN